MKKYTIEDLRNGKVALEHDSTVEKLNEVLKLAFPKDYSTADGICKFYRLDPLYKDRLHNISPCDELWIGVNGLSPHMPCQSTDLFLEKYPKVMMVSDDNDLWLKRVVFMKKKDSLKRDRFLAWANAETLGEAEYITEIKTWKYAKEVEEYGVVELTIEDISKGKGVGVAPHLIRIKK